MKELKDKGYFTLEDGTKSTDIEPKPAKKKSKGDAKPSAKKSESGIKAKKSAKSDGAAKKGGAGAAKSKKSDDDLDIESGDDGDHKSESLEASD